MQVCQEGYELKPGDILGLYVFAKALPNQNLAAIEGDFLAQESALALAKSVTEVPVVNR